MKPVQNNTLSAVIITFNEAQNIEQCIQSLLPVSDEVIVVDSQSTDQTVALAKALGAKVIIQPFLGYVEQKNFAASLATGEYILSLDADELVAPELQKSILLEKSMGFSSLAYTMNRLNNYAGTWLRYGDAYPDTKLRIWKRGAGHWGGDNPHDKMVMNQPTNPVHLKGDLLHYSFASFEAHTRQMQRFSTIAAETLFKKHKSVSFLKPYLSAGWTFLRGYFFKLGFLDGHNGWVYNRINTQYSYLKYQKLRQMTAQKSLAA